MLVKETKNLLPFYCFDLLAVVKHHKAAASMLLGQGEAGFPITGTELQNN